ncbi:hypothetical protein [Streptomyces sp. NPDC060002]
MHSVTTRPSGDLGGMSFSVCRVCRVCRDTPYTPYTHRYDR